MKTTNTKRLAIFLSALFIGSIILSSCAASQPGFNNTKKRGMKVKSSGKMYR